MIINEIKSMPKIINWMRVFIIEHHCNILFSPVYSDPWLIMIYPKETQLKFTDHLTCHIVILDATWSSQTFHCISSKQVEGGYWCEPIELIDYMFMLFYLMIVIFNHFGRIMPLLLLVLFSLITLYFISAWITMN